MFNIHLPIQRPLYTSIPNPNDFIVTEGSATCIYASEDLDFTPSFNGLKIIKTAHNTSDLTFNFGIKTLITNEYGFASIIFKGRMPENPANSLELIISENGSPILTSPFSLVDGVFNLMMKDFSVNNLNSYNFSIRILQGTTTLTTTTLIIDEIQAYVTYNNFFDFTYKKGGNPTMWIDRTDLTNTPTLNANTDNIQQLQINTEGNGYGIDYLNLLDADGKVTPINLNDVISVDFAFAIVTPSGSDRFVDIKAIVDGNVYRAETHKLLKGAGNDDFVSVSWVLPVKQAMKLNGLQIALNPNASCTVKNRYINVVRIHEAL